MLRSLLLATLLGIALAAPVLEQEEPSSPDSFWFALSKFFGDSSPTTELAAFENATATDDDSLTTTAVVIKASSSSAVFEAFGNATRQNLVRLYLETDRQMRYWRLMAVMGVLSWFESFAGYNGSLSESMKDAGLDGNDPSLMAASLEGARQMAQMMSASVQNRLGQLAG